MGLCSDLKKVKINGNKLHCKNIDSDAILKKRKVSTPEAQEFLDGTSPAICPACSC